MLEGVAADSEDAIAVADELVRRALQAGAAGFLLKETPPAEIVRAIELVHDGDGMISPSVTGRLISIVAGDSDAGARTEQARDRLATLSPLERDVALAVGRGQANADIAPTLHLSVAIVKGHVSRLLDKLEADNRVQIAVLAGSRRAVHAVDLGRHPEWETKRRWPAEMARGGPLRS